MQTASLFMNSTDKTLNLHTYRTEGYDYLSKQMIYLGTQPYPFTDTQDECDCLDEVFEPQLVQFGDITNFQNLVNVSGNVTQRVVNPSFDDGSNGWIFTNPFWTISGGLACKVLDTGGSASSLIQNDIFVIGQYYQVTIVVDSLSGAALEFTIAGNSYTANSAGTFTYNLLASATGFSALGDDTTLCCVSRVQAFQTFPDTVKWIIKDSDGVVVQVLDQQNNPESFELTTEIIYGYSITGFINWEDLGISEGCYTIGVADPNVNQCGQNFLFNGDFSTEGFSGDQVTTGWELVNSGPATWGISSGILEYNSTGPGNAGVATNIYTKYCAGKSYDVTVEISAVVDTDISLKIGTVAGPSLNTVGVHQFTIVADGEDLTITALPTAAGATATNISIDSVEIVLTNDSDYVCDAAGPLLKLGDFTCTHLFNVCHNGTVGNFDFSGAFRPMARLVSAIGRANYAGPRVSNKYANGKKRTTFYNGEKVLRWNIQRTPNYMLDFLGFMQGFKYTAIDNERIHVESDAIDPVYADNENCVAQLTIEFTKEPTVANPAFIFRDCTGVDKICRTSNLLLLEDQENYVLQPNSGRIILE